MVAHIDEPVGERTRDGLRPDPTPLGDQGVGQERRRPPHGAPKASQTAGHSAPGEKEYLALRTHGPAGEDPRREEITTEVGPVSGADYSRVRAKIAHVVAGQTHNGRAL